jgi:hypothetical protein
MRRAAIRARSGRTRLDRLTRLAAHVVPVRRHTPVLCEHGLFELMDQRIAQIDEAP